MDDWPPVEVKVWGSRGCFTRPEAKVERVSYPVMTPSAAEGVLSAILWKPEFRWQIDEIWVLNEVRWFSLLRNEVNHRASERSARDWAKRGGGYDATDSDNRAQRHTLGLIDVAYLIRARPVPHAGGLAAAAKYRDQFRRRVERGQCFATPYLGCREWSASFGPPDGSERPIDWTENLGRMLHSIDYAADGSGQGTPRFFDATVDRGVLRIPATPSHEED
jgi:CRISPR-associated protein Cas5d